MKHTKASFLVRAVALVLLLVLPLVSLPLLAFLTPPVFSNLFVGELKEKYERLCSIDEPKVILLGGSSVAFGYDSELIEQTLGMPVVNFGLYADLGTKIMMDLVRDHIGEGDIVLFAPEIDEQTLSLYFNSDLALRAFEERPSMLLELPADNLFACVGAMFNFVSDKAEYLIGGRVDVMTDIYQSAYFNEYGDVDGELDLDGDGAADYPRIANVMSGYKHARHPIYLTPASVDEDFLEYAVELQTLCERRGADFYYTYCPMNKLGLSRDDAEERRAYDQRITEAFGRASVLGTSEDYLYAPNWFFDSNFHLNSAGAVYHTVNVLEDLLLKRGDVSTVIDADPQMPALPPPDMTYERDGEPYTDPNAAYFTFERVVTFNAEFGFEVDGGYYITGLSELGKSAATLTLPIAYDGVRVTAMAADALAEGVAHTVVLPADFNGLETNAAAAHVFGFEENALRGSAVTDIYLYLADRESILPTVGIGEAKKLKIHVPHGSSYENGYFWCQELDRCTFIYDLTIN